MNDFIKNINELLKNIGMRPSVIMLGLLIGFVLGLISGVDKTSLVSLFVGASTVFVSYVLIIVNTESKEKEHRERKIKEINDNAWVFIEAVANLLARIIDYYPIKKELIEKHESFHNKRKRLEKEIKDKEADGFSSQDEVDKYNQNVKDRNDFVSHNASEAEQARKLLNDDFRSFRHSAVLCINKGIKTNDLIGVWGDYWQQDKDRSMDFVHKVDVAKTDIERTSRNVTDYSIKDLPDNEISGIEEAMRGIREVLLDINRKELTGENQKSSKTEKHKLMVMRVATFALALFLGCAFSYFF